jgi:hypothetical protein
MSRALGLRQNSSSQLDGQLSHECRARAGQDGVKPLCCRLAFVREVLGRNVRPNSIPCFLPLHGRTREEVPDGMTHVKAGKFGRRLVRLVQSEKGWVRTSVSVQMQTL